jgi:hypothetical protein
LFLLYDTSKDEAHHGSQYWCPTCWEMKMPSSTKPSEAPLFRPWQPHKSAKQESGEGSAVTPAITNLSKSSICSPGESVELEFGLADDYDIIIIHK